MPESSPLDRLLFRGAYEETKLGEALRGQACKRPVPFSFLVRQDFLRRGGRAMSAISRRNGAPIETVPGRKAETD